MVQQVGVSPERSGGPRRRRFGAFCPWCGADLTNLLRPEARRVLALFVLNALVFLALGLAWGHWLF